jgi:hypothetical protein
MRATGVLLDRVGPRLTPIAIAVFAAASASPGVVTSPAALFASAAVLGATSGAMDVAINTDGVREEVASSRPMLNLAHACFSATVVAASVATGLLQAAGAGPTLVFALTAMLLAAAAFGARSLADDRLRQAALERPRLFARVPAWLLVIGFVGALAYWLENSWQSWSAIHLERTLGASSAIGSLGPALFAASMAAGRLLVHRVPAPDPRGWCSSAAPPQPPWAPRWRPSRRPLPLHSSASSSPEQAARSARPRSSASPDGPRRGASARRSSGR